MKCLLISPPYPNLDGVRRLFPPVSLLYLAASLRKFGHEPIILDIGTLVCQEPMEVIIEKIRENEPQVVGLTCLISSAFPFIRKASTRIKELFPNIRIVIGGMHPTLFAKEILENCPAIDYIAIGEADFSLIKLVELLVDDKPNFIAPGMAQRTQDGKIIITERLPFVKDIDELPMPSWEDISIIDYKFDYSKWYNPKGHKFDVVAPVLTSRSCPFDCNFCAFNTLMGRGFRYHSPKRVVDEIEILHNKFGINYFEFIDDNISIKKARLIEICNEIIRRKLDIQFTSLSGFHISTVDEEVVDALCAAGFLHAIIPIEHGSDFMRDKVIGKKISRKKIFEVTKLFKQKGIMTRGFFILGFPEETEETVKETVSMIKELDLDLINVFNLIPFPGTRVFQQCLEHNLFSDSVDTNTLWNGEFTLDATEQNGFYLKPFAMSIEELSKYRQEIDDLIFHKHQQTQIKWGAK